MRDYLAFFNGRKVAIQAASLYEAALQARALLKVPKSKQGLLAVVLADVPLDPAGL